MKKKLLALALAVLTVVSLGSMPVFASSPADFAPIEAKQRAQETGEEVIYHEPGLYTVGEETFIDVRTYKGSAINYNLDSVYNNPSSNFTTLNDPIITPNGVNLPPVGTVWSWSDGEYSGDFNFSVRIYTNYRFTGYSSYKVYVSIGDTGLSTTRGRFNVTAIQDNGGSGAQFVGPIGTFSATIYFTGCRPEERLAFEITKPNDGEYVDGIIKVSGY